MKKIFLLMLLMASQIMCFSQAYGLTVEEILTLLRSDQSEIKSIVSSHGFTNTSGNLWIYKTQEPIFKHKLVDTISSIVEKNFYSKRNFLVATPPSNNLAVFFFAFDIKYMYHYLNWFGKLDFAGYYGKSDLYIDGNPEDFLCTSELTLKSLKYEGMDIKFKIWKDRCMMSILYFIPE